MRDCLVPSKRVCWGCWYRSPTTLYRMQHDYGCYWVSVESYHGSCKLTIPRETEIHSFMLKVLIAIQPVLLYKCWQHSETDMEHIVMSPITQSARCCFIRACTTHAQAKPICDSRLCSVDEQARSRDSLLHIATSLLYRHCRSLLEIWTAIFEMELRSGVVTGGAQPEPAAGGASSSGVKVPWFWLA